MAISVIGVPLKKAQAHLHEFLDFLPKLNEESDRGMVLIATSFIDELLARSISAFLVKGTASKKLLDGFSAPLGTFSARAAAATALGLLHDKEARDIERLRKIRNRFAHSVHASFADKSIADTCRQLEMSTQDYGEVVVDARGRFASAAVAIISNMTNRAFYVALERLTERTWRI